MRRTVNMSCFSFASARTLAGWILSMCLVLGISPGGAHVAFADVTPAHHHFVAIVKDGTPMKCQGGAPYYAVRTLKAGQVLRVDGEEAGWLRVEYLPEMLAFVKSEDVVLDTERNVVRLTKPSRLAAANEAGGDRGHWWYLLEKELPSDSILQVSKALVGVDGGVYGYLVVAPPQARGYVKAESVRAANADEIASYQKMTADVALVPAATKPSPVVAASPTTIYDIETLRSRFDDVIAKNGDEAEISEVIGDFARKIESLGQGPDDRRLRAALQQRVLALKLRQDIMATQKKAHAGLEAVSASAGK